MDYERPRQAKKAHKTQENSDFLPNPIPIVCPRFDPNDPAGYKFLEENGYAIFSGVASPDEVQKGIQMGWDFIEQTCPGVDRSKPSTWERTDWPNPFGNGIVCADGVGQSSLLWYSRGLERVQTIYKKIWNVEDVVTSYDGFCIHRAWEYNAEWRTKPGSWYHLDQNGLNKPNKICVQGFLNFIDAGETDGGLVVVPRSHLIFNKIFESMGYMKGKGDFIQMSRSKAFWLGDYKEAGLCAIKVCCKAGDFVVWDSRTIHCNSAATAPRPLPTDGSLLPPRRLVAYICMTPRERLNQQQIAARVHAFKIGATTSHWPEDCFSAPARKNAKNHTPPNLTPEQKRLIPM